MTTVTQEQIFDQLVTDIIGSPHQTNWDAFETLSGWVHDHFEVPTTTITPEMRRFFYALGQGLAQSSVLSIGSYVGYATTWLCGAGLMAGQPPTLDCLDPDHDSNLVAAKNFASVGLPVRTTTEATAMAAIDDLTRADLIFLDLDDPATGKADYAAVTAYVMANWEPPFTIVAHDMCAEPFADDIALFAATFEDNHACKCWFLPLDDSGVAVVMVGSPR